MMGGMHATFARGSRTAICKLLGLRRQAQKDKEPRVVLRIQGILLSLEGHTAGEISHLLKVHRSTVPLWIKHWNRRPRTQSPRPAATRCSGLPEFRKARISNSTSPLKKGMK